MMVNPSPRPDGYGSSEPCPDIFVQCVGATFGLGVVGGSVTQFARGLYNSPAGGRLIGAVQTVGMRAPRIGGSFAVWGGLLAGVTCRMLHVREKEDPCGNIAAGAAAGGLRNMRRGPRTAAKSSITGALLLALMEPCLHGRLFPLVEENRPGA